MASIPTLHPLYSNPKHLTQLQITHQKQLYLDQLDRYPNRQFEVLKEQQITTRPGFLAAELDTQPSILTPQIAAVTPLQKATSPQKYFVFIKEVVQGDGSR